jgi:O-antigen/teichoic acid export membrane protein
LSSFARDSVHTLALSVLNRFGGIAAGIVMARYLGPEGKGLIAYAVVGLELFTTIVNGVAQAATHQYAHRKLAPADVYDAMVRIVTALSIVSALGLGVVAVLVPSQRALLAAAVAIPFAMYAKAVTGILLGAQQVQRTNVLSTIAVSGFNVVAIIALVALRVDAGIILAVWVASQIASAVYGWASVRTIVGGPRTLGAALVREQAGFAAKAGGAQVAGYINMRIDVIVVSAMLGARALGVYTLAVSTAELLWLLSQPLCWAAFGRIAAEPLPEAAAFTAKLTRHVVALVVPLAAIGALAAPVLITLVYGDAFAAAGRTVQWLMPGVAAYALEAPLGYFLMVKLGRPGTIVVIQFASVAVCAAATVLLVPTLGIDGAAIATSATYVGVVIIKAAIFVRATGVGVRELLLMRGAEVGTLRTQVLRHASVRRVMAA